MISIFKLIKFYNKIKLLLIFIKKIFFGEIYKDLFIIFNFIDFLNKYL